MRASGAIAAAAARFACCVVVGVAAFAMSCAFEWPLMASRSLGADFAAMAADPWALRGPFPHRILGPILAWLLGLGGERYWIFAHAVVVVFLSLVCAVALQRARSWPGAVVLTATVAVTGAVELYKQSVGYAEPMAYALLLLGVLLVRAPRWFWCVQLLGLLNHEGSAFFWPWLLWVKARENGGLRRVDWLAGVVVIAVYAGVRWSILARVTQPVFDAPVYFHGLPSAATVGTWCIAALSIGIYFGVLPVLLAWHARRRGFADAGAPTLLVLGAVFAMCAFATDLPRFVGYLALPVTLAGCDLLRAGGVWRLAMLGAASAIAIVAQRPVTRFLTDEVLRHMPDPLPAVVLDRWWLFAAYGVAFAVMIGLGWQLARRDAQRTAAA